MDMDDLPGGDKPEGTRAPASAEPMPSAVDTETSAAPRSETRFPLAFDVNGNPVKVPPQAVAWRVRRGGGKRGRPRNVFDTTTGRQLEIALGSSIEDLTNTNVPADRYLLYPVDEHGTIIPGAIAVTEVTEVDDADEDERDRPTSLALSAKDPVALAMAVLERTVNNQNDVIKASMENHSRSLESATSGYAPLRPVMTPMLPAPQPVIIEQPAQALPAPQQPDVFATLASALTKPEVIGQILTGAQYLIAMFKNASAASGTVGGGGAPGVAT